MNLSLDIINAPDGKKILNKVLGKQTNFTLPDEIDIIKKGAFSNCAIDKLIIPKRDKFLYIERCAFDCDCDENCYVNEILIETKDIGFEGEAFSGSRSKKIVFPSKIAQGQIMNGLFSESFFLEEVVLPENINTICAYAFFNCCDLKKITLPSSLIAIGTAAFEKCKSLEEIIIPDSVIKIEEAAFRECDKLKSVHFPKYLKDIDRLLFYNCKSLFKIEFPNDLKQILDAAFTDCSSLTQITLPTSVEFIGGDAFARTNLDFVYLPKNITHIEASTFAGIKNKNFEFCAHPNVLKKFSLEILKGFKEEPTLDDLLHHPSMSLNKANKILNESICEER